MSACLFSIITLKLSRRGEFSSREDPIRKMLAPDEFSCESARPFEWDHHVKIAAKPTFRTLLRDDNEGADRDLI